MKNHERTSLCIPPPLGSLHWCLRYRQGWNSAGVLFVVMLLVRGGDFLGVVLVIHEVC